MRKPNGQPYKVSPETLERMKAAQRKRMEEGRHNFYKGHPVSEEQKDAVRASIRRCPPRKGKHNSPEHKAKQMATMRPVWDSPEYKEKMSRLQIGRKQSAETIAKRLAARAGYRHSEATRRKMSEAQKKGADHPNWRGGATAKHKRLRGSMEFKLWREAVFARDDWTCQHCGERGGELHPDHILPFADYPGIRFDVDNGRTLCKACHMKTDTWGWRGNQRGGRS